MRVLSLASGKGGVGKSFLALNLAHFLAELRYRVLVIDGNVGNGQLDVLFRDMSDLSIADVIGGKEPLMNVIRKPFPGIHFIPAGAGLNVHTHLTSDQKTLLISELDTIDELFDLAIIDTPPGLSEVSTFFCTASTDIILTTTPEITSIISTLSLISLLAGKFDEREMKIIVNMAEDEGEAANTFEIINEQASRINGAVLTYIGHIPFDYTVMESIRFLQPVMEKRTKSNLKGYFLNISQEILRHEPKEKIKKRQQFFMRRLLKEEHDSVIAQLKGVEK